MGEVSTQRIWSPGGGREKCTLDKMYYTVDSCRPFLEPVYGNDLRAVQPVVRFLSICINCMRSLIVTSRSSATYTLNSCYRRGRIGTDILRTISTGASLHSIQAS